MRNGCTGNQNEGRCILDGATLNEINLTAADLESAIIRGTTLLDAELSDAKLRKAIIEAVDFQRALLGGADFTEAHISESDFGFGWMAEAGGVGRGNPQYRLSQVPIFGPRDSRER